MTSVNDDKVLQLFQSMIKDPFYQAEGKRSREEVVLDEAKRRIRQSNNNNKALSMAVEKSPAMKALLDYTNLLKADEDEEITEARVEELQQALQVADDKLNKLPDSKASAAVLRGYFKDEGRSDLTNKAEMVEALEEERLEASKARTLAFIASTKAQNQLKAQQSPSLTAGQRELVRDANEQTRQERDRAEWKQKLMENFTDDDGNRISAEEADRIIDESLQPSEMSRQERTAPPPLPVSEILDTVMDRQPYGHPTAYTTPIPTTDGEGNEITKNKQIVVTTIPINYRDYVEWKVENGEAVLDKDGNPVPVTDKDGNISTKFGSIPAKVLVERNNVMHIKPLDRESGEPLTFVPDTRKLDDEGNPVGEAQDILIPLQYMTGVQASGYSRPSLKGLRNILERDSRIVAESHNDVGAALQLHGGSSPSSNEAQRMRDVLGEWYDRIKDDVKSAELWNIMHNSMMDYNSAVRVSTNSPDEGDPKRLKAKLDAYNEATQKFLGHTDVLMDDDDDSTRHAKTYTRSHKFDASQQLELMRLYFVEALADSLDETDVTPYSDFLGGLRFDVEELTDADKDALKESSGQQELDDSMLQGALHYSLSSKAPSNINNLITTIKNKFASGGEYSTASDNVRNHIYKSITEDTQEEDIPREIGVPSGDEGIAPPQSEWSPFSRITSKGTVGFDSKFTGLAINTIAKEIGNRQQRTQNNRKANATVRTRLDEMKSLLSQFFEGYSNASSQYAGLASAAAGVGVNPAALMEEIGDQGAAILESISANNELEAANIIQTFRGPLPKAVQEYLDSHVSSEYKEERESFIKEFVQRAIEDYGYDPIFVGNQVSDEELERHYANLPDSTREFLEDNYMEGFRNFVLGNRDDIVAADTSIEQQDAQGVSTEGPQVQGVPYDSPDGRIPEPSNPDETNLGRPPMTLLQAAQAQQNMGTLIENIQKSFSTPPKDIPSYSNDEERNAVITRIRESGGEEAVEQFEADEKFNKRLQDERAIAQALFDVNLNQIDDAEAWLQSDPNRKGSKAFEIEDSTLKPSSRGTFADKQINFNPRALRKETLDDSLLDTFQDLIDNTLRENLKEGEDLEYAIDTKSILGYASKQTRVSQKALLEALNDFAPPTKEGEEPINMAQVLQQNAPGTNHKFINLIRDYHKAFRRERTLEEFKAFLEPIVKEALDVYGAEGETAYVASPEIQNLFEALHTQKDEATYSVDDAHTMLNVLRPLYSALYYNNRYGDNDEYPNALPIFSDDIESMYIKAEGELAKMISGDSNYLNEDAKQEFISTWINSTIDLLVSSEWAMDANNNELDSDQLETFINNQMDNYEIIQPMDNSFLESDNPSKAFMEYTQASKITWPDYLLSGMYKRLVTTLPGNTIQYPTLRDVIMVGALGGVSVDNWQTNNADVLEGLENFLGTDIFTTWSGHERLRDLIERIDDQFRSAVGNDPTHPTGLHAVTKKSKSSMYGTDPITKKANQINGEALIELYKILSLPQQMEEWVNPTLMEGKEDGQAINEEYEKYVNARNMPLTSGFINQLLSTVYEFKVDTALASSTGGNALERQYMKAQEGLLKQLIPSNSLNQAGLEDFANELREVVAEGQVDSFVPSLMDMPYTRNSVYQLDSWLANAAYNLLTHLNSMPEGSVEKSLLTKEDGSAGILKQAIDKTRKAYETDMRKDFNTAYFENLETSEFTPQQQEIIKNNLGNYIEYPQDMNESLPISTALATRKNLKRDGYNFDDITPSEQEEGVPSEPKPFETLSDNQRRFVEENLFPFWAAHDKYKQDLNELDNRIYTGKFKGVESGNIAGQISAASRGLGNLNLDGIVNALPIWETPSKVQDWNLNDLHKIKSTLWESFVPRAYGERENRYPLKEQLFEYLKSEIELVPSSAADDATLQPVDNKGNIIEVDAEGNPVDSSQKFVPKKPLLDEDATNNPRDIGPEGKYLSGASNNTKILLGLVDNQRYFKDVVQTPSGDRRIVPSNIRVFKEFQDALVASKKQYDQSDIDDQENLSQILSTAGHHSIKNYEHLCQILTDSGIGDAKATQHQKFAHGHEEHRFGSEGDRPFILTLDAQEKFSGGGNPLIQKKENLVDGVNVPNMNEGTGWDWTSPEAKRFASQLPNTQDMRRGNHTWQAHDWDTINQGWQEGHMPPTTGQTKDTSMNLMLLKALDENHHLNSKSKPRGSREPEPMYLPRMRAAYLDFLNDWMDSHWDIEQGAHFDNDKNPITEDGMKDSFIALLKEKGLVEDTHEEDHIILPFEVRSRSNEGYPKMMDASNFKRVMQSGNNSERYIESFNNQSNAGGITNVLAEIERSINQGQQLLNLKEEVDDDGKIIVQRGGLKPLTDEERTAYQYMQNINETWHAWISELADNPQVIVSSRRNPDNEDRQYITSRLEGILNSVASHNPAHMTDDRIKNITAKYNANPSEFLETFKQSILESSFGDADKVSKRGTHKDVQNPFHSANRADATPENNPFFRKGRGISEEDTYSINWRQMGGSDNNKYMRNYLFHDALFKQMPDIYGVGDERAMPNFYHPTEPDGSGNAIEFTPEMMGGPAFAVQKQPVMPTGPEGKTFTDVSDNTSGILEAIQNTLRGDESIDSGWESGGPSIYQDEKEGLFVRHELPQGHFITDDDGESLTHEFYVDNFVYHPLTSEMATKPPPDEDELNRLTDKFAKDNGHKFVDSDNKPVVGPSVVTPVVTPAGPKTVRQGNNWVSSTTGEIVDTDTTGTGQRKTQQTSWAGERPDVKSEFKTEKIRQHLLNSGISENEVDDYIDSFDDNAFDKYYYAHVDSALRGEAAPKISDSPERQEKIDRIRQLNREQHQVDIYDDNHFKYMPDAEVDKLLISTNEKYA